MISGTAGAARVMAVKQAYVYDIDGTPTWEVTVHLTAKVEDVPLRFDDMVYVLHRWEDKDGAA